MAWPLGLSMGKCGDCRWGWVDDVWELFLSRLVLVLRVLVSVRVFVENVGWQHSHVSESSCESMKIVKIESAGS